MPGKPPIAELKIRGVADMADEDKHELADWLQRQAEKLFTQGRDYAPVYLATYEFELENGGADQPAA